MYIIEETDYSLFIGNISRDASEVEEAINQYYPEAAAGAWLHENDRLFVQFTPGYCESIKSILGIR